MGASLEASKEKPHHSQAQQQGDGEVQAETYDPDVIKKHLHKVKTSPKSSTRAGSNGNSGKAVPVALAFSGGDS